MTATGDENPLSTEEQGDLEYRRVQLKRLQEEVVDIEEMNSGVSIMDLGLNEFRLDLLEYMRANPDIEHTPFGLHAVVPSSTANPPGVVYVLKNRNDGVNIDRKNRLHPFYLVYVAEQSLDSRAQILDNSRAQILDSSSTAANAYLSSNISSLSSNNISSLSSNNISSLSSNIYINHLAPKDLLDRLRQLCRGKSQPDLELCHAFNRATRDGQRMTQYSALLGDAITSIVSVKEQSDIDSFLEGFQGSLFDNDIKGLDDFELICFLVIR
jgi:hypothetical protein